MSRMTICRGGQTEHEGDEELDLEVALYFDGWDAGEPDVGIPAGYEVVAAQLMIDGRLALDGEGHPIDVDLTEEEQDGALRHAHAPEDDRF